MSAGPLYIVAAVLVGLSVGSFVNVIIFRLPRELSVVKPRSFCPECRRSIPWYENIPLLSYIVLGGRCRGCRAPIPARYPIVEATGGILAVLVLLRFGTSYDAIAAYAFLMALVAVTLIDWDHRIIPDEITLSFLLAGLVWSFLGGNVNPLHSFLGALAGGGVLYGVGLVYKLVRHAEGMGGGDVKLMAMIGAFLGIKFVLPVIVLASLAGTLYGVVLLRSGKGGKAAVAFGSFLAPAAALCIFYGPELLGWYTGHF
jgi:leader peptidase (prepilin peptidase)/N-methyltransferase